MESIIILGTGNATVTKCYNTCFAMKKENEYFLVDTGGGNGILTQLEKADIPMNAIHHIFISHEHTDHLLGIVWLIRMIATQMKKGKYIGDLQIYCYPELEGTIRTIVNLTVQDKFARMIGERIFFVPVLSGEQKNILGYEIEFFDIESTKAKQFGFSFELEKGKKFTFLGDEPYQNHELKYAQGAQWLLHEAFCRYEDREIFEPYEKHHATVKDACELAERLEVENLLLYHTEDKNIDNRKELYMLEGRKCYTGNLWVPDDLDEIILIKK
ncbi:MAG: MBL fold metallo-hydrolase [Eubacteriales bacterium]